MPCGGEGGSSFWVSHFTPGGLYGGWKWEGGFSILNVDQNSLNQTRSEAMAGHSEQAPQRVLIASANPLFGKGLEKLLYQRWKIAPEQVRLAGEMGAALEALDQ